MNPILDDIHVLLVRELESLRREIDLFPEESLLWSTPKGIANPAGTLALHGCGNLNHYIGAVLGNTGYVRDRDEEFNDRSASKEELTLAIRETIHVMDAVLPGLSSEMLDGLFPQPVAGLRLNTRLFLLHLCCHLAFHVGQVGYLRRILTGEETTADAVSLRALVD